MNDDFLDSVSLMMNSLSYKSNSNKHYRFEDNYQPVREITNYMMEEWYKMIENSLKYFSNCPSSIKSISKYYKLYFDNYNERYWLLFIYDGEITFIREYPHPRDYYYRKLTTELWMNSSLNIEPSLIIPHIPK